MKSTHSDSDPTRHEVWDAFWSGKQAEDIYPAVSDLRKEILRVVPDPLEKRILEVGAGTGREGHALAQLGAHVTLLDISMEALQLTRRISSKVHFVRGNATCTPFADNSFDFVYHQGLMEHFHEAMPLLLENRRILRPGGLLLVDVPQRFHWYTALKHLLMLTGQWFAGWETEYSPGELERLVRQAGLDPLHRYGYAMHPGLAYRLIREAAKRIQCKMPLHPDFGPLQPLFRGCHRLTEQIAQQRWGHNLAATIGIVARKP